MITWLGMPLNIVYIKKNMGWYHAGIDMMKFWQTASEIVL